MSPTQLTTCSRVYPPGCVIIYQCKLIQQQNAVWTLNLPAYYAYIYISVCVYVKKIACA